MKRIKVNNAQETLILTGMIVSTRFLRDVQSVLDRRLLKSGYSRKIAMWCVNYYKENESAPGAHIQDVFNQQIETGKLEEDDTQMIGRILARISDEYEGHADSFNEEYVLKVAENFFSVEHMKKKAQEVLDTVDADPLEAMEIFQNFQPKLIPQSEGYDVLRDSELTRRAFTQSRQPIFLMPGALGSMVNEDLCRGSFIGLLGSEKIGKTFQLMEFAFQAARQNCNIAIFQAGDMDDEQQSRRVGIRVSGKSDLPRYCKNVLVPVYDCVHNQNGSCSNKNRTSKKELGVNDKEELLEFVGNQKTKLDFFTENDNAGYTACQYCRRIKPRDYEGTLWYRLHNCAPLEWREADRANQKLAKRMGRKRMMMRSWPSDTVNIPMIYGELERWSKTSGFVPDFILTDYADLFIAPDSRMEFRHATNSIWKGHRSLSQKQSALTMTVTQADADAMTAASLSLKNFSEDKRKFAHVTSFYSLNQTPEEKVAGLMRYGSLLSRDGANDTRSQINVMQCYPIARAHMGSFR